MKGVDIQKENVDIIPSPTKTGKFKTITLLLFVWVSARQMCLLVLVHIYVGFSLNCLYVRQYPNLQSIYYYCAQIYPALLLLYFRFEIVITLLHLSN